MRNILTVYTYELTRGLRRKGFLFATFGIPLLGFLAMMGFQLFQSVQTSDDSDAVSGILADLNIESIRLAGLVDNAGAFPEISEPLLEFFVPFETTDAALVALRNGEVDVFYEIEDSYLETGSVTLYLPSLSLDRVNRGPIEQLFYTTLARDIDPVLLNRLRTPIEIQEFNLMVTADTQQNADANFLMLYIFVLTFLLGMFLTNGYLLQSVIEEKENKVVEVLITSIKATELLAGKVLAFATMGLLQIVVWVVGIGLLFSLAGQLSAFNTLAIVAGLRLPVEQLPIMALFFISGYLLFAGVFGAVGAISNSMREGPSYAAIFTLPAALPFYFFTLFQATPNGPLPTFLSIFPITAPISMMMRLSVTSVPPEQIVLSLVLLFAAAGAMMWFAGRIFRVQSLLSGKVPKLRDIPNLIRG